MKRFWTMLVVVAVALVMALPAGAVKPENPGKPPPDEPLVGLTCAEAAAAGFDHVGVDWDVDNSGRPTFTVEVGVREDACVDVTSLEGNWIVTVDMGTALVVPMGVQDSVAPGDSCWGGCAGDVVITESGTYTFYTPASTLNACDDAPNDPDNDFGDGDSRLTFSASASYRGPAKSAVPATITVTLPTTTTVAP